MKCSVIFFSVIFLLLMHNLHYCNPEPITLAIGLVSSLIGIGEFLWKQTEKQVEKRYLQERLLSSSESVRENYARDIKSNLRTKFPEPSERVKAEENHIQVDRYISDIEQFYTDMRQYYESFVSGSHNGSLRKMLSEAEANLSNDVHRPMGRIRSIYQLLIATDAYSIYKSLEHRFQEEGYMNTCSNENNLISAQKYILDYLMLIAAAGTKVFMTVKIASEILKTAANEHYSFDVELINKELDKKYTELMGNYMNLLKKASRDVWRCDPSPHVEDVTYTKLNNVFNLFVSSEKHLAYNDECVNDCSTLNPRSWNPCLDTTLGVHCPGELWDCESGFDLHINLGLEICVLAPNESRRYDYIKLVPKYFGSDVAVHYGEKKSCDNGKIITDSLTYKWGRKCDICTCISDHDKEYNKIDPRHTERFFYYKPVLADVSNNYVMTGVRLVKKDGIVFFEFQQGKLLTLNTIEPSSVSWETIESEKLYNPSNLMKIHWHQRSIELQDIDVPYEHVLVGLQIHLIKDRIVLKVFSLPIDFINGNIPKYQLIDKITATTVSTLSKTGLNLEDHDLPDPKVKSDKVVTGKYIQFSTSSVYKDLGQTTIPFLDTQNVTTKTPTMMSGAGIFFKYSGKHAGYVALKLKTFDCTQKLTPNPSHKINF